MRAANVYLDPAMIRTICLILLAQVFLVLAWGEPRPMTLFDQNGASTVSYTHLTLPTILLV